MRRDPAKSVLSVVVENPVVVENLTISALANLSEIEKWKCFHLEILLVFVRIAE